MVGIRKDTQAAEMYAEYQRGRSLSQVATMFGVSRQAVYELFKNRGMKTRSATPLPYQHFNGTKYTLRKTGYYSASTGKRELMHRAVWRHFKGEIPSNHDIHHKNRNRADNRINNLECIDKAEHARKFSTGNNQFTRKSSQEQSERS